MYQKFQFVENSKTRLETNEKSRHNAPNQTNKEIPNQTKQKNPNRILEQENKYKSELSYPPILVRHCYGEAKHTSLSSVSRSPNLIKLLKWESYSGRLLAIYSQ